MFNNQKVLNFNSDNEKYKLKTYRQIPKMETIFKVSCMLSIGEALEMQKFFYVSVRGIC